MASPALLRGRVSEIGAFYAVTMVCAHRAPVFSDARAARLLIDEIERCHEPGLVHNLAWVVMPDHAHWLFELRGASVSGVIQRAKSRSGKGVNAALGRQGPLWQTGFYDHRIREQEDLRVQARYLVENPIRRGLVERIEDYPFWGCCWIQQSADLV